MLWIHKMGEGDPITTTPNTTDPIPAKPTLLELTCPSTNCSCHHILETGSERDRCGNQTRMKRKILGKNPQLLAEGIRCKLKPS